VALRRFLVLETETDTAWCPDYYRLIKGAKYLGVKPWELLEQPIWWLDVAIKCMTAEAGAEKILNRRK